LAASVSGGSFASKAVEALHPCTSAALPKADVNSPPWLPPLSAISRREQVRYKDSLDDLVGDGEHAGRNRKAERFCCFQIDD
jgi:hypothetical protein